MELAEFLNPPDEAHGIDMDAVTDQDIFDAVTEARREEEGLHDGDDDDTVEPIPTLVEVLKAASTIIRYTRDKDGAYFRELESTIALFLQWIRTEGMVDPEQ